MNKIAWIGLGQMGVPMARNLAKHGYPVTVYNRTPKSVDMTPCQVADSLHMAVDHADVVFLMLSDGAAVEHVVFGESGAIHALSQGALIVNMSTVGVDETKQFALRAAEHQVEWMDAPVSGSVGPAEAGTLVVLAGGSESAFHRVKPLLATMAKSVHHLGPVGSGAAMKLLVNGMLAATVAAASECMALAEKSGLGRERFLDVLSETGMWSPILAGKRPLWLDDEYHPSFALKHMTKDLALLSRFAVQYSAALPGMTTALTTYLGAQAQDLGDADMAAVFQHLCALAGAEL